MERINRIIRHKLYLEYIEKIKLHEKDRIFCKHDTVHFLDVCRLAEIDWLKQQITGAKQKDVMCFGKRDEGRENAFVSREMLYAAGLLHDIGRWQEYEQGIRHEIASSILAPAILKDCGFTESETKEIVLAVSNHRNSEIKEELSLSGYLYRADKKSRPCFLCEAGKECDWSAEKKNLRIV